MEIYLFMKNLTDFRKTVETGVDPHLLTIRIENDRWIPIQVTGVNYGRNQLRVSPVILSATTEAEG